ncbi:hypothetical protein [Nitrosomonas halophila]|uniref:Uncharacterized protein n=1 Tax=Nitrosomonas halophila TaxID=44576 RepID=A0A1H3Q5H0_9PROT|nr:hypothetical protein [Nitrosomonas halophila]SDZ08627.1 hypothetical protein SAMN05421881_11332 [Nitrosomonas halophila]
MTFRILQYIDALYYYAIEARQQLRIKKSQFAFAALHDWLMLTRQQTTNGDVSAKYWGYIERWPTFGSLCKHRRPSTYRIQSGRKYNWLNLLVRSKVKTTAFKAVRFIF